MYALVHGLVPGKSGSTVHIVIPPMGGANHFSFFGPLSNSSIGELVLSLMVGGNHSPLYLSSSGRTSQETAIKTRRDTHQR